ncbi:MAG: hypothetical protein IKD72_09465 [Clostridia bacterium]|nr:hypothetical protein [Clostridia bacterium]
MAAHDNELPLRAIVFKRKRNHIQSPDHAAVIRAFLLKLQSRMENEVRHVFLL